MSNKIDPVIHFELPADDTEGLAKFYTTAFGWQTQSLGAQMDGYVLAFTGEIDPETRIPKKRGLINGGFYKKTKSRQGIGLTILVDDIKAAMKKVEAAGGKVLGEPFEMPGVGLFVSFMDPDGNVVTLNQDFTVKHL
jgi:uncharacterized protein